MSTLVARERSTYFESIVGLRMYLALWVALGHGATLAGFADRSNPLIRLLVQGYQPVCVFMIISGFVIANLLLTKKEPFLAYAVRRFFRLYPAFLLCCLLGFLVSGLIVWVVHAVPWQEGKDWISYRESWSGVAEQERENFWPHALLHLGMLHGLMPAEVLPEASVTFLGVAWSISLEWQFYLLAPLLLHALLRPKGTVLAVAIGLLALLAYRRGYLGEFRMASILAANIHFFVLGMVSRLAMPWLSRFEVDARVAILSAVAAGVAFHLPLAVMIWGAFFAYMLWGHTAGFGGRLFQVLTASKPMLLMGEASYSLYLVHFPVQVGVAALYLRLAVPTSATMLVAQLVAIAVSVGISIALYFGLERPSMWLGARIARHVSTSGAALPSRPAVRISEA